jgi:dienelactone hydrolase
MFEYFPTNYVWNLATNLALGGGALIGEIDEPCRALREASYRNDAAAQEEWFQAWSRLAQRVEGQGRADAAAGHELSAGRKLLRAFVYFQNAERMAHPKDPRKTVAYRNMLDCFRTGARFRGEPIEWVEIPYEGRSMPALFIRADSGAKAPCMIHFDGLDVMKEWIYLSGVALELRRRGVSTLIVDHPGVGEALRLREMHGLPEIERAASASIDYLETRADTDARRIGIMALSLGGYYAPRVAAFEKRIKCCIAWGAMWNWHNTVVARLNPSATTQPSVSNFGEHLQWVFGKESIDEVLRITQHFTNEKTAANITCPLLLVHGENDRQIPLIDAERMYNAAINSSKRELKVFRLSETGAEHCQADNGTLAIDYMTDWAAEVLGGRVKHQ